MKRIFAAGFFICMSCQSFAAASFTLPSKNFYLGVGAGGMFYKTSGNNYLNTGPGWPNDYYSTNGVSSQPYGLLAAGYTWQRKKTWLPNYSLGLRYMFASNASISGNINQYSLPAFKNYHYSYDVQTLTVLAILKADIYRWNNLMPYIMAGAGVVNYSTPNYSEQALVGVTPRVSPAFGGVGGNNFAYQLAVGLDYALRQNVLVNIEYDYNNYGTIRTGKGANYVTATGANFDNESLKNKLSATSLFLGVSFYVG